MVPSLPPASSSPAPSFFFRKLALYPGSKSLASFTLEPGLTRNGSMNSASSLALSSAISHNPPGQVPAPAAASTGPRPACPSSHAGFIGHAHFNHVSLGRPGLAGTKVPAEHAKVPGSTHRAVPADLADALSRGAAGTQIPAQRPCPLFRPCADLPHSTDTRPEVTTCHQEGCLMIAAPLPWSSRQRAVDDELGILARQGWNGCLSRTLR